MSEANAALQTRDPGSFFFWSSFGALKETGVPDQRCTAPLTLRAAPHPGHTASQNC
jgi:hypothetical protein